MLIVAFNNCYPANTKIIHKRIPPKNPPDKLGSICQLCINHPDICNHYLLIMFPLPPGKRLTLLLLSVFTSLQSLAQQHIRGVITDNRQNVLPFTTVVVQSLPDSNIVLTAMSDSSGAYQLTVNQLPHYLIRAIAAGYEPGSHEINGATDSLLSIDLSLKPTGQTKLKDVTINAAKPLVERKIDRTVFNVENSVSTIGADGLEALRKAPGVRVTNNVISIAGKSTVNVLLNDKLIQLSGDELASMLKSIPADNIARIEVITTPPARYDAAGNAGLINIVTKKNLQNGLNGNTTISYMQRTSNAAGFNANLNYRHNKLNIFGYGNAYHANAMPYMSITTKYTDQQWEQHSDVTNQNVFNRFQLGADYNLTPRSIIGVLYTRGNGGDQYTGDAVITSQGRNLHTGLIDSFIVTHARTQDRGVRNVGNLNYEWKIDSNGRKLNADIDYFTRTNKAYRNLTTGNFLSDGLPTGTAETSRTSGKQLVDIRSGKVDVAWPTTFAVFSFGAKVQFIHNTSDNLFENLVDTTYLMDPGKTNRFDYTENTQALYVSAQKKWEKWEFQAGLRAEYTQTKGYSATLNQTNRNDYFKLFPTLYIQYKPDEDHSYNLNYSKRIQRPDFWDMNPFRSYFTAVSYSQGNPFLQPSFSNNIEASFVLKSNYTFTVYANFVSNLSTRVSFVDTVNKAYSFNMANVGKTQNYGFSASATLHPLKWWDCLLTGNGFYALFSSDFYGSGRKAYSRPAFTVETNNTFNVNKKKTIAAELNFVYNSAALDDFDFMQQTTSFSVGIKAMMLQKKLILAMNVYDLFRGERIRLENQYNGTTQNNYWDERAFRVALTWKFGNNKVKEKRERQTGSGDEGRAR